MTTIAGGAWSVDGTPERNKEKRPHGAGVFLRPVVARPNYFLRIFRASAVPTSAIPIMPRAAGSGTLVGVAPTWPVLAQPPESVTPEQMSAAKYAGVYPPGGAVLVRAKSEVVSDAPITWKANGAVAMGSDVPLPHVVQSIPQVNVPKGLALPPGVEAEKL